MTEFPEPAGNIRATRFFNPQPIVPPRPPPRRRLLWVSRAPVGGPDGNGDPTVLLDPVEHDLGVRPLDLGVLQGVFDEPVEVPTVAEAADQQSIEVAGNVVDRVRPGVPCESLLDFPQLSLGDPDPDRRGKLPAERLVVEERHIPADDPVA